MFFLYIFPVIDGSKYQKKRGVKSTSIGYVSPPNIGALTPPMHGQYNFSCFITRNCNITRPLPTPFRNSTNKNLIYYALCVPPNSMTCICLWFFIMPIFRIHVNFWFILHRLARVASKLVQKPGRDKQSKKYLQFAVFTPLLPPT